MKTFKSILILFAISFLFLQFSNQEDGPKYWYRSGSKPASYKMEFDKTVYQSGVKSIIIESLEKEIDGFATIMQTCNAKNYLGTKIKMTGYIKSENAADWAGMWLRVDPKDSHESLAFDNMQDRPVRGTTDWTKYEIVLDVPAESGTLNFGVLMAGTGKIWFDNVSFEILDNKIPVIPPDAFAAPVHEKPENLGFEE